MARVTGIEPTRAARVGKAIFIAIVGFFALLMTFAMGRAFLEVVRGRSAGHALGLVMVMGGGIMLLAWYGLGALVFFAGFNIYSQFRRLENLPRITIRAVPMGLVAIQGKAAADALVSAPITHTPCCGYRVKIDGYHPGQGRGGGSTVHLSQVEDGKLYLEDETGRVLVDLRNLEFDMSAHKRMVEMRSVAGVLVATGFFNSRAIPGEADDNELREQVRKWLPQCPSPYVQLYEYAIVPGPIYSLTGTCAENPQAGGETDRNIIMKGQSDPTYRIAARTRDAEIGKLRTRAYLYIIIGAVIAFIGIAITLPFALLSLAFGG
jgi:hypothetical protein